MATAQQLQNDIDALKAAVEAIPARVVAAINAVSPLTQAQLDAADAEVVAITGEANAVAPASGPVSIAPASSTVKP